MFLLRGRLAPSPDPTPLASVRPHSAEREMQQEEEEAPASQPSLCAPSSSLAPGPIPLRSSSARLRRRPGFWGAPRTVYGNIRELRPTPRSRFGMYTYISHFPTLFRGNVEAKNIAEWCQGNGRGFPRGIRKLVACKQKKNSPLFLWSRSGREKKFLYSCCKPRESFLNVGRYEAAAKSPRLVP